FSSRRRHTRCLSDWSSDVCSSDLIPKRGFTNPFKQPAQVVNVRHLGQLAEGVEVTPDTLFGAGLVRRPDRPIKLLGMGDVQRKFSVKGVTVSASARSKIEQAGGTIAS